MVDHALAALLDRRHDLSRNPDRRPNWLEADWAETNVNIVVGEGNYFLSADGYLMPTRNNQPPPDPRYFKQTPK